MRSQLLSSLVISTESEQSEDTVVDTQSGQQVELIPEPLLVQDAKVVVDAADEIVEDYEQEKVQIEDTVATLESIHSLLTEQLRLGGMSVSTAKAVNISLESIARRYNLPTSEVVISLEKVHNDKEVGTETVLDKIANVLKGVKDVVIEKFTNMYESVIASFNGIGDIVKHIRDKNRKLTANINKKNSGSGSVSVDYLTGRFASIDGKTLNPNEYIKKLDEAISVMEAIMSTYNLPSELMTFLDGTIDALAGARGKTYSPAGMIKFANAFGKLCKTEVTDEARVQSITGYPRQLITLKETGNFIGNFKIYVQHINPKVLQDVTSMSQAKNEIKQLEVKYEKCRGTLGALLGTLFGLLFVVDGASAMAFSTVTLNPIGFGLGALFFWIGKYWAEGKESRGVTIEEAPFVLSRVFIEDTDVKGTVPTSLPRLSASHIMEISKRVDKLVGVIEQCLRNQQIRKNILAKLSKVQRRFSQDEAKDKNVDASYLNSVKKVVEYFCDNITNTEIQAMKVARNLVERSYKYCELSNGFSVATESYDTVSTESFGDNSDFNFDYIPQVSSSRIF